MASVNRVTIVGNVGKDPDVRSSQGGRKIVNMTVATSESWSDKASGERQERTEWHRVSIMNDSLSAVAEKYIRKGSKVYLEGKLQTRKWTDQSGQEKYTTEIILGLYGSTLVLLDRQQGDGKGTAQSSTRSEQPRAPSSNGNGDRAGGSWGGGRGALDDDDIPFAACFD